MCFSVTEARSLGSGCQVSSRFGDGSLRSVLLPGGEREIISDAFLLVRALIPEGGALMT